MRKKTPLHTRIFGTTAAALVAGVLAWGGAAPTTGADEANVAPQEAMRAATPVALPLQATVARPRSQPRSQPRSKVHDIGPCPKKHSPVIWQGLQDGRPTWKHADGSVTQRVRQRARTRDGEVVEVPTIVSMRPAAEAETATDRR